MEDNSSSQEIKKRLYGKPYLWQDVYYCFFNNVTTFPHSTSILCRIKVYNGAGGVVYCTNPQRCTYVEYYTDDNKALNFMYNDSKRKILSRIGLSVGYEGKILNEPKYS